MNDFKVGILTTGIYLPEREVTNLDLEKQVTNFDPLISGCTLDQWIQKHYGIIARRIGRPDELPSEMASKAALDALEKAGLGASEIDFIVLNTAFGDYNQPTTATAVQQKLNMRENSFALELNMPCAGPVYGIVVAIGLISTGMYKRGLVIGVDKMSSLVDPCDFKMASMFGEGAGACVVTSNGPNLIQTWDLGSSGEKGAESEFALLIKGGKAANPFFFSKNTPGDHFLKMNGKKVEDLILKSISTGIEKVAKSAGLTTDDIKYIVPHQAAKKAILGATRALNIIDEKVVFSLPELGNTSSASLLITLDQLFKIGVNKGDSVVLVGMGAGLNWGSLLFKAG